MSPICAICGRGIALADASKEHILPHAIGGRRTVGNFLHGDCNNHAGQTWDASLEKQLRPIALHIGIKRQSGKTLRMAVTTTAHEDFLLDVGGKLAMVKPVSERTPILNGEHIHVTAGSIRQARDFLKALKREYPKVDVEATVAGAESQRSYAKGNININLNFGGPSSGRSLVKAHWRRHTMPVFQLRNAAMHYLICVRLTRNPALISTTTMIWSTAVRQTCLCIALLLTQTRQQV